MKRKVFLTALMVMALMSIFAISVFAEEIVVSKTESAEYGTVIQLSADPGLDNAKQYVSTLNKINDAGTDTDALCILTDGDTENPSYYVFPSSYVVDEREDGVFDIIATPLATAVAEFNSAEGTSYFAAYKLESSGSSKRLDSMVRFTFPSSVVKANSTCCIRSYPRLVEIKIKQAIDFSGAEKMFYGNSKLASVIGFEKVDGTKLPKTMFAACSALRYIKLPTNTNKIPGSFFQGAKGVNIVNMEELANLTVIEAWAFDGTQNLVITLPDSVTTLNTSAFESAFKQGGSITINPTSQLTTIGNKAFSASAKLESIYIPSTVTSIGENAFDGSGIKTIENFENCQITVIKKYTFSAASKLTSIKIPKTVTTIEDAFLGNTNLTKVYIPETVTSIADTFYKSSWNAQPENIVFLYIGKDASALANCLRIAGANVIPAIEYKETNTYTGVNLVAGYSNCMAYNNGVHPDQTRDLIVTSYLEDIKIVSKCNLCGMYDENGKIPALFECLGYSAPENGAGSITIGFIVNNEAIDEYEELSSKTISYGVFAVSKDKLGNSAVFAQDGTVANGVLSFEIKNCEFQAFELKVSGFVTDEQKSTELALGTYVKTTFGETVEYSYLQESAPNDGDAYHFITYNDAVANSK